MSTEPMGPYENERQATAEPMPEAVRALHNAGQVKSGDSDRLVRDTILGHLLHTCEDAGVYLGAYDRRVLVWLSSGETSIAQVLIGLISRAYAAGREQAGRGQDAVRVGQVWADNDKRSAGRHLLIDLIVGDKARVLLCTAAGEAIKTRGKYTVSAIRLDRFRPTSSGYRLVKDAPEVSAR